MKPFNICAIVVRLFSLKYKNVISFDYVIKYNYFYIGFYIFDSNRLKLNAKELGFLLKFV